MSATQPVFAGASGTSFPVHTSGGTVPHFSEGDSTRADAPQASAPSEAASEPAGLVQWLDSPGARQYEGQWVLLDHNLDVFDADASPSALLTRHAGLTSPLIVFVQPRDVTLAV